MVAALRPSVGGTGRRAEPKTLVELLKRMN